MSPLVIQHPPLPSPHVGTPLNNTWRQDHFTVPGVDCTCIVSLWECIIIHIDISCFFFIIIIIQKFYASIQSLRLFIVRQSSCEIGHFLGSYSQIGYSRGVEPESRKVTFRKVNNLLCQNCTNINLLQSRGDLFLSPNSVNLDTL